jgi:hypothetical protein
LRSRSARNRAGKLGARPIEALLDAKIVASPDSKAENSFEDRIVIRTTSFPDARVASGIATADLPPLSATATSFQLG